MDPGSIDASSVPAEFNGRRRSSSTNSASTLSPPCGACKFLRRKCTSGCVFAPHFLSDQGAARFAAVHKVFGASNVSKLLKHLPLVRRHDAVATICYEAQARLADPVFGCVSTVILLQQQVAALQSELTVVQTYLMNTQLALSFACQQQNANNANDLNNNITTILNPPCNNLPQLSEEIPTTVLSAGPPPTSFDFSMNGGGGFPRFSSGVRATNGVERAMYDDVLRAMNGVEMMDISNPATFVDEMFD